MMTAGPPSCCFQRNLDRPNQELDLPVLPGHRGVDANHDMAQIDQAWTGHGLEFGRRLESQSTRMLWDGYDLAISATENHSLKIEMVWYCFPRWLPSK